MFWCVACEELDLETYLSFPLISKAPSLRMAIALGIISAMMHNDFEEVYNAALATQSAWASGNVSRFEIVEQFFDTLIPRSDEDEVLELLPKLKILVTTAKKGYEVTEASDLQELRDLLVKTTWM